MTNATCAVCGKPFPRQNTLQRVCGLRCATRVATASKKSRQEAEKALRGALRQRKEAAKSRRQLLAEAQTAFNRWIRQRDQGKPCICCGAPMEPDRPGGSVDAGHYMGIGACPELRFDEANVHAQRKSCNRPGGTTRAAFRAGMIERVGLAEVERLEGPHPPRKYTADDLREIRDHYRAAKRVNPDHLFLGTAKDNWADARAKSRNFDSPQNTPNYRYVHWITSRKERSRDGARV